MLSTTPDLENGGFKLDLTPDSSVGFNGANYHYLASSKELTLNEAFDQYGRLTQLIGNLAEVGGEFGSHYADEHGEDVTYGTIQVWNVYNLSADTHPMHFHLFNVMVMRRQSVKLNREGMPVLFGRGRGPEPNETGWKETVRMNPGECTTVAVLVEIRLTCSNSPRERKEIPRRRTFSWRRSDGSIVNSNPVPSSPRLSSRFGITAGEYVWHCHILEHEEHDMMHSLSAAE